MAKIAPKIWTDTPPCGTGVQMSKVYPAPGLRWLVWYGGQIVRFCKSVDQAFVWYMLIQAKGLDEAVDTLQEIADSFAVIERKKDNDLS